MGLFTRIRKKKLTFPVPLVLPSSPYKYKPNIRKDFLKSLKKMEKQKHFIPVPHKVEHEIGGDKMGFLRCW